MRVYVCMCSVIRFSGGFALLEFPGLTLKVYISTDLMVTWTLVEKTKKMGSGHFYWLAYHKDDLVLWLW